MKTALPLKSVMDKFTNKDRSAEILSLELRIKKLQILIAIVTLIGVLITTLGTWKIFDTTNTIDSTSTDINDIKSLLAEKPLEGQWHFYSDYEKYYDEPDPHLLNGSGKAIIVWKNLEKRYDIHLSYQIYRSAGQQLLTAVLQGFLTAGNDGWPDRHNFIIDRLTILSRLHYKNYAPSIQTYLFKDCNVVKKGNRAESITCDFVTPQTKSKIELKWSGPLH